MHEITFIEVTGSVRENITVISRPPSIWETRTVISIPPSIWETRNPHRDLAPILNMRKPHRDLEPTLSQYEKPSPWSVISYPPSIWEYKIMMMIVMQINMKWLRSLIIITTRNPYRFLMWHESCIPIIDWTWITYSTYLYSILYLYLDLYKQ